MRVLVVEDDSLTLDFLAKTLRGQGYAVDTASEGKDGLFKARSWDYDAILLDILLPGIDGWSFLQRLRETKKTPVLMLTSCKATPERVRGLDSGADDYVVKPFDPDELLARLRALIRRTTAHAHPIIAIGDVTIDLTARTVTRSGKRVALSPREYGLVEYLALHLGKITPRSTLYDHLFDEDNDTLSNVIDVIVGRVRKKLGKEFIATHHGHGYSIAGGG